MKNIRIKQKITLFIVGAALIGSLGSGLSGLVIAEGALTSEITEKLEVIRDTRKVAIEDYLQSIKQDLHVTATNDETAIALQEFSDAWVLLGDGQTHYLQYNYIKANPHPLGEKHKLDVAADGSFYSKIHAHHHTWFRELLEARGYYDIFLFDMDGNLLYTVFKELDYATNINTGEWKDTDLGNAFRAAAASKDPKQQFFYDFKPYAPSNDAPASFIAEAVLDKKGNKVGVIAFQMPIDGINKVMTNSAGLGEHGESYLVGKDMLMRSQSRNSSDNTILSTKVDTEAVEAALSGLSGVRVITDAAGEERISAYTPFTFEGVRMAILTEVPKEEALAHVYELEESIVVSSLVTLLILGLLSLPAASSISRPMVAINGVLGRLAEGETEVQIKGADRKDEVGDLARSALVFKQNIAEKAMLESEAKRLEQQAEKERKAMMQKLADQFEQNVKGIVNMVSSAATELSMTAQDVAERIDRSSLMATNATTAAQDTTSNVESVAAAAEELTASVREISSQIQRSNDLVNASVKRAEDADVHAQALLDSTTQVRDVIQLISDISGQINLLSLNATIESARAGEAGKGFAVVASEVKNLANQTDQSIQTIQRVIEGMDGASADIVSSLSAIKTSIEEISHGSSGIASAVEEQSATTDEIASNMQTASSSTRTISSNLDEVAQTSTGASQASREILQASQELSQQAAKLDAQVDEFLSSIRSA